MKKLGYIKYTFIVLISLLIGGVFTYYVICPQDCTIVRNEVVLDNCDDVESNISHSDERKYPLEDISTQIHYSYVREANIKLNEQPYCAKIHDITKC